MLMFLLQERFIVCSAVVFSSAKERLEGCGGGELIANISMHNFSAKIGLETTEDDGVFLLHPTRPQQLD